MRESNLLIINIIKSMITDRIGRHDVLLPIDQNNEKISEANYLWLICFHKKKTLLGEMRDKGALIWGILSNYTSMTCAVS